MSRQKIKTLTVLQGFDTQDYEVGKDGIDHISNDSQEYKNSFTPFFNIYRDFKNHDLMYQIINCPVIVEYLPKEYDDKTGEPL